MKVLPLSLLFLGTSLAPLQAEDSFKFEFSDSCYTNVSPFYTNDYSDLIYPDLLLRGKSDPYYDLNKGILLPHPLLDDKESILNCAREARERANECLERAEDLLDDLKKVKDWRLRERLEVLIASSIGTVFISDPKTKFLSVALALFTDLIIKEGLDKTEIAYNIFLELSHAAHCLEEFNYYSRLSFDAEILGSVEIENEGWKYANYAINSLTRADMLTTSLEYKLQSEIVSSHLTKLREVLMNDMIKNRRLTTSQISNHLSKMEIFSENFSEIVAECSKKDRLLIDKIQNNVNSAFEYLKLAKKEFRGK